MTQDLIMALVNEYAAECSVTGFVSPSNRRAAVVAALEALVTETKFLRTNYTKLKKLVDDGSAYERAYSAGLELMKENESLLEKVAALTKDAERLDHIQVTGSTVEIVNFGQKPVQHSFRVGGLYKAINFDLRLAIDAAIAAQKGEQV